MSTAPAHALTASPRRRLARAVMATGSVAAVLLSMGPLALVRAGVVVAVLTAIVACVAAWREVADVRRRAAKLAGDALVAHGAKLREQRETHLRVLTVLQRRHDRLAERLDDAQHDNARLRADAGRLAGERDAARHERDALRVERDGLLLERDELRLERDVLEIQRDELAGTASPGAVVLPLRRRA